MRSVHIYWQVLDRSVTDRLLFTLRAVECKGELARAQAQLMVLLTTLHPEKFEQNVCARYLNRLDDKEENEARSDVTIDEIWQKLGVKTNHEVSQRIQELLKAFTTGSTVERTLIRLESILLQGFTEETSIQALECVDAICEGLEKSWKQLGATLIKLSGLFIKAGSLDGHALLFKSCIKIAPLELIKNFKRLLQGERLERGSQRYEERKELLNLLDEKAPEKEGSEQRITELLDRVILWD